MGSKSSRATTVRIRTDLAAGDLGKIVTLHGTVYDAMPGYGLPFEAYVAKTVSEYVLGNQSRGRIWLAERDGALVGCIAIAHRDVRRGQLRWLVVDPDERGRGIGRKLVERALAFCLDRKMEAVYLETTDGLEASMNLYLSLGFEVTEETQAPLWDGERALIVMEKRLNAAG